MKSHNLIFEGSCCEAGRVANTVTATDENKPSPVAVYLTVSLLMVAVWFAIYSNRVPITDQITQFLSRILGFSITSHLGKSIAFFIYDTPKVFMLLALVLLYGLFGWKIAAIYMGTGLAIAMIAGWIIGRLKMERHLEEWVYRIQAGKVQLEEGPKDWAKRIEYGIDAVKDIVGNVWVYVVLGIAVGAGIHGYVPEGFLTGFMGKSAWWSVPLSVLLGIPMYSNAAGIIPIVQALLGKGAALGPYWPL